MIPPPTPTLLPPGTPFFSIPPNVTLWAAAPYTIQSWNMSGDARYAIQAVFVLAMVIIGGVLLTKFLQRMTDRDAQR